MKNFNMIIMTFNVYMDGHLIGEFLAGTSVVIDFDTLNLEVNKEHEFAFYSETTSSVISRKQLNISTNGFSYHIRYIIYRIFDIPNSI